MKISAQPRKKLALLLFGVSKSKYIHFSKDVRDKFSQNGDFEVDYKYSVVNYRERIFKYFNKLGYDIDIYFATNNLSAEDRSELLATYPAVDYRFQEKQSNYRSKKGLTSTDGGQYFNRNIKFRKVLTLCLNSGNDYDLILATRFDLIFVKDFENFDFDLNLMNISSVLESPHYIDDNFYLFPGKFLEIFTKHLYGFNLNSISHTLGNVIKKFTTINFFSNQKVPIAYLNFYKIVRGGKIKPHPGHPPIPIPNIET